jgi:lipopolysaccharide export system protein LptC
MATEPLRAAPRAAAARARRAPARPPRAGSGYTRFVMLMKVVLPLIAAVLVALVAVWPQFRELREGFRIELAKLNLPTGGQRVTNARYTGTDSRGRPFTVTAEAAMQEEGQPGIIKLERPKADITLQGDVWVATTAAEGSFNRNEQVLELGGGVSVFHDAGFEMHSPSATLDLKHGVAEGHGHVEGQGPTGTLTATGFRVLDNGARVLFIGPAKMVMRPGAETPTRAARR